MKPSLEPPVGGAANRQLIFVALAAVVFSFWIYSAGFHGDMLFDDFASLHTNPSIRRLTWEIFSPPADSPLGGRPISNASLAFNYLVSGTDPAGYRVGNLLLHVLVAAMLVDLLRRLLARVDSSSVRTWAWPIAVAVGGVWLLHPVHSASVSYVAQRTEILAGFFVVGTVWAWVKALENPTVSRRWILMSVVLCILGMGSKEGAVVAPLVALLVDWAFFANGDFGALKKRRLPYAALALSWAFLAFLYLGTAERGVGLSGGVSAWKYLLTQSRVVLEYAGLAVWPSPLVLDRGLTTYRANAEEYKFLALTTVLFVSTVVLFLKRPRLGFLPLLFFVLLAPTSSVIPIWRQPMAENRLYLPAFPILAGCVLLAFRFLGNRVLYGVAAVAAAFGVLAQARVALMASEVEVWKDNIAKAPGNYYARDSLGAALLKAGRLDEARATYESLLKERPNFYRAQANLGVIEDLRGNLRAARDAYEKALFAGPTLPGTQIRLVRLYIRGGRLDAAQPHLSILMKEASRNGDALTAQAVIALDQGRTTDARASLEAAMREDPRFADAWSTSAALAYAAGDLALARAHGERALSLDPQNVLGLLVAYRLTIGDTLSEQNAEVLKGLCLKYGPSRTLRLEIADYLASRGYPQQAAGIRDALAGEQALLAP